LVSQIRPAPGGRLHGHIAIGHDETNRTVDTVSLDALLAEWSRTDLGYQDPVDHLSGSVPGGIERQMRIPSSLKLQVLRSKRPSNPRPLVPAELPSHAFSRRTSGKAKQAIASLRNFDCSAG
jgi:hypothetical protein